VFVSQKKELSKKTVLELLPCLKKGKDKVTKKTKDTNVYLVGVRKVFN